MKTALRPYFRLPANLIRTSWLKLFNNISGWKFFFGKNCEFRQDNGKFSLLGGNWIEDDCVIQVCGGTVSIGKRSFINRSCYIVSRDRINIGDDVIIGNNCTIIDHDHSLLPNDIPWGKRGFSSAEIAIGNGVWIGSGCVVLKGVSIGDNSVIAAGAVVKGTIPANEIWGGVPAKKIKNIQDGSK